MRNYWLKILLGALGVFAVGMIGVTIVRSGIAKVNSVVEGSGPITIPLGLVPFVLSGERLGKLNHVTLYRESPRHVSGVELTVDLSDSLLAQGLSGCRLVANIEGDDRQDGVNIRVGRDGVERSAFSCLPEDSTLADFAEYGEAVLNPGEVEIPLLLPLEVINELQSLDFGHEAAAGDSLGEITVPNTDSIAAEVERQLDSAMLRRERGESRAAATMRFADSVRAEALKQIAEEADPQ
ncbi:MAG TPA: hypothetical protein VF061_09515 [Gemmatimonadales bacterium]|jgi:hypothetical protein